MSAMSSSPFGDGCCTTPGTSCVIEGKLAQPADTIVIPLGADTLMATVQLTGVTAGTISFAVSMDGETYYPLPMIELQPGGPPPSPDVTHDGVFQGTVAGWAQFRIKADDDFSGPAVDVIVRLTSVSGSNSSGGGGGGGGSAIFWTKNKVTLTGGNDWLLTPDPTRRGFMLYAPIGNGVANWNPDAGAFVTPNDGIPLVAGAAPTVFTFPECGASYIVCTGVPGDIVTVWKGN